MPAISWTGTVRTIAGALAATYVLAPQLASVAPAGPGDVWLRVTGATACLLLLTSTWLPATPHPARLVGGWAALALTLHLAFAVGDLVAALLGLPLAVALLSVLAGQVRPRTRKALLTVHVGLTGTWLGVVVVMLALAITAAGSDEPALVQSHYALLERLDNTILAWVSVTSILSGLALGLTGKWGLVKHYWVLAKVVISIAALAFALAFLHGWVIGSAARSAEVVATNGTTTELGTQPRQLVAGFVFAVILVLAATVLSVYKPWGRTRTGRTPAPPPGRGAPRRAGGVQRT